MSKSGSRGDSARSHRRRAEWTLRHCSVATLEQRRELGESELVLDSLHVEDVMRLLGAAGQAIATRQARAGASARSAPPAAQDWRSSLRDAGVNVDARQLARSERRPSRRRPNRSQHLPGTSRCRDDMAFKKGIVVGTNEAELIPGAIEKLRSLDEIAEKVAKCTRCPLYATATKLFRVKAIRRRSWCASAKRRERRRMRRPPVCRAGGPAAHKDSRGDRSDARAGIHLQRSQAPAAGKSKSAAGRGRSLQSLPDQAARAHQAESNRRFRNFCGTNAIANKDADRDNFVGSSIGIMAYR